MGLMEADERLWIIPTDLRPRNKASTGLVIINLFVMDTCTVHAFAAVARGTTRKISPTTTDRIARNSSHNDAQCASFQVI